MNRETAADLLNNLVERAKESSDKIFLTSREIAALQIILDLSNPAPASLHPHSSERKLIAPEFASIAVPILKKGSVDNSTMLCIDFGTSFSKAFACSNSKDDLPNVIDLAIGEEGGNTNPLLIPSEMIVDEDVIYFGSAARKFFDESESSPERLIDSIKQYMTLGADVRNLAKIRVDPTKDPHQKFFQRDILLLYLAYLTFLTEKALQRKGHSENIRRRFAHPAWKDEIRHINEEEMKVMMAEAIVLARSLKERLLQPLPISVARRALDDVKALQSEKLPHSLIAEPIREATAAGAGALLGTPDNRREAYIIIDIGAGTTDVAGCYCVNNPQWERPRVFEVTSAAAAAKSAGNVLDSALVKIILGKLHLTSESAEYHATQVLLLRNKRINKERLFETGTVVVDTPTGEIVEVKLQEFLKYDPVQRFANEVKRLVENAANAITGNADKIVLIATGGGARLPIIEEIANSGTTINGRHIAFTLREPAPVGMAQKYPDLVDPYPQIAVAVGGALPFLPEQRASVSDGIGQPRKLVINPMYKS